MASKILCCFLCAKETLRCLQKSMYISTVGTKRLRTFLAAILCFQSYLIYDATSISAAPNDLFPVVLVIPFLFQPLTFGKEISLRRKGFAGRQQEEFLHQMLRNIVWMREKTEKNKS